MAGPRGRPHVEGAHALAPLGRSRGRKLIDPLTRTRSTPNLNPNSFTYTVLFCVVIIQNFHATRLLAAAPTHAFHRVLWLQILRRRSKRSDGTRRPQGARISHHRLCASPLPCSAGAAGLSRISSRCGGKQRIASCVFVSTACTQCERVGDRDLTSPFSERNASTNEIHTQWVCSSANTIRSGNPRIGVVGVGVTRCVRRWPIRRLAIHRFTL